MAVFCWLDKQRALSDLKSAMSLFACGAAVAWTGLALVCGWPGLGANAGSLTVSAAGFGVALGIVCGKKPSWSAAAAFTLIGFLAAFAFGSLDAALNGAASSHSGAAILAAANGRGAGYLAQIALRKIILNFHYLAAPGFLAGLAAICVSLWIATMLTGKALERVLEQHVWLARSFYPLAAAAVAALLFKDSGVVTVDFMAGSAVVVVLYYVITDAPASITAGSCSTPVE